MTASAGFACPYCHQAQAVIRAGHNRTGSQRYRCHTCARYFTPQPRPLGVVPARRTQALQLYLEGTSLRAIGRLLGVHHQSVANWVAAAAAALPPEVTATPAGDTVEVDELYTFVGKKAPSLHRDGRGPRQWRGCGPSGGGAARMGTNARLRGHPARGGPLLD